MDKKKFVLILICIILSAVIVISAINLIIIWDDNENVVSLYDETFDKYVIQATDNEVHEEDSLDINEQDSVNDNLLEEKAEIPWYEKVSVDLEALQEINSDIIGYLYFENEDIRYPILYSGDNDYYLRRTFEKKDATAGSIFLEGQNSPDLKDVHTLIYGHNMRNLSMFGKLRFYRNEENYYNNHKYFMIFTNDFIRRYEIIACKNVGANSDIYTVVRDGNEEFLDFTNKCIINAGVVKPDVVITENDQIVTLSTCSGNDDIRYTVSAIMIDEYRYGQELSEDI